MPRKDSKKKRVRRIVRKLELIMAAGGKCSICGYDKNLSSLVFHHLENKLMALAGRQLGNYSMSRIKDEADKCILLCHNCHNELHNPKLTKSNILKLESGIKSKIFTLREAFDYLFIFKN